MKTENSGAPAASGASRHLFIYGSGGIGCELVDIVARINRGGRRWDTVCFVDDIREAREHYATPVLRFEEMLARGGDLECVVALGEPAHRRAIHEKLTAHGVALATVIDPSAVISATASIGAGCIIGPHSFVSSHTRLEENVMLEIHTVVGHDIVVGRHSVVSSGTVVGGASRIGEESFIGLNCSIKERVNIGDQCIVGMHSAVFNDIGDGLIALGNPARPMRRNDENRVFKA